MATLLELKMSKEFLRNKMDDERKNDGCISVETFEEYNTILARLRVAESRKLNPIKCLILLIGLLCSGGCIENTMRETGKLIQQGGRVVTGIGTDWTRGAEGYANEK